MKLTAKELKEKLILHLKLYRAEVDWYRRYGKHGESRIRQNRDGVNYVIGDWSWNRLYPEKLEFVESAMSRYLSS